MRYVKLPIRVYKTSDIEMYDKTLRESLEDGNEWKKTQLEEEGPIPHVDTFMCLPLKDLEGAMFEPCTFLDEEELNYSKGELNRTVITTKGGSQFPVTLSLKEVAKKFCKWGLIDESFLKEFR